MRKFPAPIHNLVAAFSQLPGVGPKTALRYVFTLLQMPKEEVEYFAKTVSALTKDLQTCQRCRTYTQSELCDVCEDPRRDVSTLCVVAESRDIATMEATNQYKGYYFVLGGLINPIDGAHPNQLAVRDLFAHLDAKPEINEIILAFSPNVHGETTMMYLSKRLKESGKRVTQLARGLPLGADLEYADEVTLGEALTGRREI